MRAYHRSNQNIVKPERRAGQNHSSNQNQYSAKAPPTKPPKAPCNRITRNGSFTITPRVTCCRQAVALLFRPIRNVAAVRCSGCVSLPFGRIVSIARGLFQLKVFCITR